MKKKITNFVIKIFFSLCVVMLHTNMKTEQTVYGYNNPEPELYEFDGKETGYDLEGATPIPKFAYEEESIGEFQINGNIVRQDTHSGYAAYGVDNSNGDAVTFEYNFVDYFHSDNKETWNLYSDNPEKVADQEIKKKNKEGVLVVQKSADGKTWELAAEPVYDAFKESGNMVFYTIPSEEIQQGTYYKIYVAYAMRREIGKDNLLFGRKKSKFEYKKFLEKYEFYVCNENNYVELRDSVTKNILTPVCSVQGGFYIQKNGSTDVVTVKYESRSAREVKDYETFTEPGLYNVEITTKLGKKDTYLITVTEGFFSLAMAPKVYECEKDKGFEMGIEQTGLTSFGIKSYTTLKIAQNAEFITKKATHSNMDGVPFDAYGVSGDTVRFFLRLNYPLKSEDGWKVVDSDWGKKKNQKVCGVQTGEVGTGALIIQTSKTGKEGEWKDLDKGRYADGLYTTDYGTYYAANEEALIYTPDGDAVKEGVYVRILYAYQVKDGKEYIDCVEKYEFYLCSNNLGAVTFKNLSLTDKIEEIYGEEDENTLEVYKKAESLPADAGTVTGFSVNRNGNLTIKYTVEKDGQPIEVPANNTFVETGKYDIHLVSAVGDERTVTLYVDTSTNEEALENYFGTGFIEGKRIYSAGEYPVYEGGKTSYHLEAVGEEYLPISGTIENIDTGEVMELGVSREARNGVLTSAGNYVATFRTGMTGTDSQPGDTRVFVFRFQIIPEGTMPGPVLNKQHLAEYVQTNISDVYPVYYAVTYQSAAKGYITLAFQKKEDAVNYAYSYEQGMVEKVNGVYRYNGSFTVKQKETYDSTWDLADAMYYFAEQAVYKAYFDLSDKFTYFTLEEYVINNTKNLRTRELNNSVVIFADGQRERLTVKGTVPVINDKVYAYVEPGLDGTVKTGKNEFQFLKDEHGYDSYRVQITDCNGKVYDMEYNKSVGKQLEAADCPSGIITITEKTVYGDSNSYNAVYIKEGENTAKVSLRYYDDGQENMLELSAENSGLCLETDAFSIEQVVDDLLPFSLVLISKENNVVAFADSDQVMKEAWSEPGTYTIRIVNRMGYDFSFDVVVRESMYSVLSFSGEGTEDIKNLITSVGEANINLPEITRYGYELAGYEAPDGMVYTGMIDKVPFETDTVLTAKWIPKQVEIILKDSNGNVLETRKAAYGTEINLGIPMVEEGYEFAEWKQDGVSIANNLLSVNSEEPITVQYTVKTVEIGEEENTEDVADKEAEKEQVPVDNEAPEEENEGGGNGWKIFWTILGIIGILVLGFIAFWVWLSR